jgi:hypothetical protein
MTDRGESSSSFAEDRINEDPEQGEGPEMDTEGEAPVSAKTGFERNLAIAKDIIQILAIVAAGTFVFSSLSFWTSPR